MKKSKGFTLIEVLVALAILAGAFSVIFQGFNQMNLNAFRVSSIQDQVMIESSIFNEISAINPAEQMSGQGEEIGEKYTWKAVPISSLLPLRTEDQQTSRYIQMYRVSVSYSYRDREHQFSFEQMGWEIRRR
ncbi:type II secretion system protein [Vibrio fluvialis]|uniref:type II secretion system protein n=1 Tax=Vibrio fluvialis TaxID=676 RepID=UPI0028F74C0B|nr:prepilin-type N-terminal cleavage/methylation domain-containing protein [Vibrio fluvialis]